MKQPLSIIAIFFTLFVNTSFAAESNLRRVRSLETTKASDAPEEQSTISTMSYHPKKAGIEYTVSELNDRTKNIEEDFPGHSKSKSKSQSKSKSRSWPKSKSKSRSRNKSPKSSDSEEFLSESPSISPSMTSYAPSMVPTTSPSYSPSKVPSDEPSMLPSLTPSDSPSMVPSSEPSGFPSMLFDLQNCDSYFDKWLFDLTSTCGSDDLSTCQCMDAQSLINEGKIDCNTAICPGDCTVCNFCLAISCISPN